MNIELNQDEKDILVELLSREIKFNKENLIDKTGFLSKISDIQLETVIVQIKQINDEIDLYNRIIQTLRNGK